MDSPGVGRRPAIAVSAAVLVGGLVLYVALGTPAALAPAAPCGKDLSQAQAEAMILQLSLHLGTDPDNAQGWLLLARAQTAMHRYPEAAQAYRRLIALTPEDPELQAAYAEVLAQAVPIEPAGK